MITSYERIVHTRLLEYELEADKIAAVLCANAGYDPFSLSRITRRLSALYVETTDIFDESYLSPNDMAIRAANISEFSEEEFSRENAGAVLDERFLNYKNMIN
jgi:predicted Zn-dependent protease